METQRSITRLILYGTALGALALGAVLVCTTAIPFDWIKPQIDALSVDGNAEKFTQTTFAHITRRTLWGGFFLIAIGVLILWRRTFLLQKLDAFGSQFAQSARELGRDLRQTGCQILTENRTHTLLIGLFLMGGIAYRLAFLGQPIRHDEAFTFTNYASKPLILALSNYSFPNNHLFHTVLVNLSYNLFGNQLWAIRLPAFLAGIAILPLTYLLIHALYNRHAALIALGLTACASANIEYATNARGYTLITACFLIISLLAVYLRQKNNPTGWVLFGLVSALGFYTIPVMLYPFAGVMLWLTASIWMNDFPVAKRQGIWILAGTLVLTILLTGILYAPMMLGSGMDALIGNRFVQSTTLRAFFIGLPGKLHAVWHQWTCDLPAVLAWALGLSAIVALLCERRQTACKVPFAATVALGLFICLSLQTVLPPPRVWLYLLPLFFGLVGSGFDIGLRRLIPKAHFPLASVGFAVLLAFICGFGAFPTLTRYYPYGPGTLRDAERITLDLKPEFQPQDRLLTIATAAPLEYYFLKHRVPVRYLRRPIQDASRVILVVLEDKYTLQQVLDFVPWPKPFGPPRLLKIYPSARLYVLQANPTLIP